MTTHAMLVYLSSPDTWQLLVSLIGSQFFETQPRTHKPSGTLADLKNRTPIQPIRRTKLNKFS